MCFKKNSALSIMLLMSSFNLINAEESNQENNSLQETQQERQCNLEELCNMTDINCPMSCLGQPVCKRNINQSPEMHDMLEKICASLSDESRKEFESAFDELTNVFEDAIASVDKMTMSHQDIINKYKEFKNIEKMNFMISPLSVSMEEMTKGPAMDFDSCISGEEMKAFYESLNDSEKNELQELYKDMSSICCNTRDVAKSKLEKFKLVNEALKDLDSKMTGLMVGFDKPFPCSYIQYTQE